MQLKRILRRLTKQLTPLIALTMALIAVAGLAAAVQLFLLALPWAGVAAILVGAGLVLLTWKVHVTSLTSKQLHRELKLLAAAPRSAAPTPAAPTPVPLAPTTPERTVAEKLRVVGTYAPASTVSPGAPGRLAASVPPDPDAPFRLFAATHGMGAPETSAVSRRAIAFIGSDELAEALAEHGSIHRLHPGVSAAELEHAHPSALVVEEDALSAGPWSGALAPQGARLLLELRVAMAWMRRNTGAIFVLPATGRPGMAAQAMRADTILIDDDFLVSQPSDAPSLATTLAQHRDSRRTS